MLTPHQAKYFAYELTKRCPSDSVEKFSATLLDAQVDLNPHQVDAALFAFKSPLSNGAILADEVGLGKTIEAGILLSQKWAEGNRKLIVICPSNLRKQWSQELEEKFFLPNLILEKKNFKEQVQKGKKNPFEQKKVVICSYHFARSKDEFLQLVTWDNCLDARPNTVPVEEVVIGCDCARLAEENAHTHPGVVVIQKVEYTGFRQPPVGQ